MKKFTFLLITLLFVFLTIGYSQGLENFDNSNATSSYTDNNFVGENGITWYYIQSRDGNNDANGSGIDLPALMLRRLSSSSKVYSETISGGIGTFSVKLYKGFTGGGDRQVELFINDVSKGTSTPFDDYDEHIFTVENINLVGDIVIRIDNITEKQVIVDDITWTAYAGGGNQNPSISNVIQSPEYPTSSDAVSISADITDGDGTISTVELHWGTMSGSLNNTITMSDANADNNYETDSNIPVQINGTTVYYEVYAEDNEAGSSTSTEQSYTVTDPATTTLPYSQTFDSDLGDCNTYSVSGAEKVWHWESGIGDGYAAMNGYNSGVLENDWLIIPGIDFSAYTNVYMTFDTWYNFGADDADNYLKLLYSTDYSGVGDTAGSTWTELVFTQPSSASTWTSSGIVNLSAITESGVYIAFNYHYNAGSYRSWRVDNISIQESTSDPEPTNYPTNFDATVDGSSAITNTWTDAVAKTQLPSGYLILANLTGTFTAPEDGTPVDDDTDLSDGEGAFNIAYGVENYQWTGLTQNTPYYFIIYPYSNTGSTIDYKTDETPPTANATTEAYTAPNAWINEFHYDNMGDDAGEFVEVVIENAGAFTLSDFQINLYNGSGGASYNNKTVDLFTEGATEGNFTFYFYTYPPNGFQNGAPDGLALSYQGILISGQFLSYEGSFEATDGPADGVTSTDIGVDESNNTTEEGESLQLKGGGETYDLFTWQEPAAETPGALNNKQYLGNYTTWNGSSDNDWAMGANWNNGVPEAVQNVIVPQGVANYPTLSAAANCNDLIIESNENGNASILGNSNLTVGGTTTVERYIKAYTPGADPADGWHNISSPVNNMAVAGSDFEPGANDDLYQWDESTNTWENYKQGHFTNFTNGMGFLAAYEASGIREFVGTLNSTDITITNLSADDGKFHLLGNPFASAVIWNNGDWGLTDIGGVAKIWEESNFNYTDIEADGIIPSTNGFFVEVVSAANSITIPGSARTHDLTNNYKKSESEGMIETLKFTTTNDENTYYDVCKVGFKADASEAWDVAYDSHKLFGSSGTSQMWTVSNSEIFSINYLPYVYETYQLPLYFKAGVNGTHHINVEGMESFYINSEVYLEDVLAGETINLNEQQLYSFSASTTDNTDRFILHFFGVTSVGDGTAVEDCRIYSANNTVYIKYDQLPGSDLEVSVFNTLGQQLYSVSQPAGILTSFSLNERAGIYIIRVRTADGVKSQKVMIR